MHVKAAVNTIAVKPLELSELSQGTLATVVAVSEKQPMIGEVLDVGWYGKEVDSPFEDGICIGDKILYRKYGSTNFFVGGKEVSLIGFGDIVGKIIEKED